MEHEHPRKQTKNAAKERAFLPQRLNIRDEHHLVKQAQKHNNMQARNQLVIAHMGLIHFIAKQLFWPPMPYEDLVQEGTLGFMRAVDSFDSKRGVRLATYSAYWIRAKMQQVVNGFLKEHFPLEFCSSRSAAMNSKNEAKRSGTLSLDDRNAFGDGDKRCLQELLPDNGQTPEDNTLQQERLQAIRETLCDVLRQMNDPRLYIILRYRLLNRDPETLTAVGKRLQMSREGARLLEHKILRMARRRLTKTHVNLLDKEIEL